jgi:hypothetical protein
MPGPHIRPLPLSFRTIIEFTVSPPLSAPNQSGCKPRKTNQGAAIVSLHQGGSHLPLGGGRGVQVQGGNKAHSVKQVNRLPHQKSGGSYSFHAYCIRGGSHLPRRMGVGVQGGNKDPSVKQVNRFPAQKKSGGSYCLHASGG